MDTYEGVVESVEILSRWVQGPQLQRVNDHEVLWTLTTDVGKGHISILRLRPGLVIAAADFMLLDAIVRDYNSINQHCVSFTYCMAGRLSLSQDREGRSIYSCRDGYEILAAIPEGGIGKTVVPPAEVYKCVAIYLSPALFYDIFPGMEDFIHPDLNEIVNGRSNLLFYEEMPATAAVQMAMRDILSCPYTGPYRQLFMESKAMELMTHTLWRSRPQSVEIKHGGLRPGDIERVNNAKKIMDMSFREDIRLLELARQVGLPHTKLNLFFRQLHGTTIFGYLRELRMDEARFLLSEGEANVTETAYAVGYSSLSHFAKVFKKYCGQAPGDFMRHASGRQ